MVPILNHSLFININNKIPKVIIDIVIDIGLEIIISLYENCISLDSLLIDKKYFFKDTVA